MSYIKPKFRHPKLKANAIGCTKADYEGAMSTLCAGCGHDSITASIIKACYELAIEPHKVLKISGIGCSSKTPAYFLGKSHGFNSVHGRMPSIATGANASNRDLVCIGVSGDGDTASIGMGQFAHIVRRDIDMLYIVANNGCYGLTKGQDSATADKGSKTKKGEPNPYPPINLVNIALELGATFVARGFAGDKEQLVPLIKAAIEHKGFALLDIISPCVTFNNNEGSTKSYQFMREHSELTGKIDLIHEEEEINVSYDAGSSIEVEMHDGYTLHLQKLHDNYDPTNREDANDIIRKTESEGKILTGLIYINHDCCDFHNINNTIDTPLYKLQEDDLCPNSKILEEINKSFK